MADSKSSEQEPSIEEILTSIRQIISDDDDEDAPTAPPAKKAAPEPEPDEDDEVIELTEKLDSAPEPIVDDTPEPEPEPEPIVEIDMQDAEPEPEEDDFASALNDISDDIDFSDAVVEADAPEQDDSLLTRRAEEAAYSGFKKLAAKTALDTITGVTIEEIVRDEIRPMLRVWLDENLPDIVERLVKDELDKVARRAIED